MLPRTSARLKERIENRPPATSQIVTKAASRPQKKKKSKGQAAVNVSPDTHSTKKSQPATYARVKGRKGKLRNMTEMPMDVLFEIFGRLEPVDLLHLSRATKSLRSILIAPNANFLWKMVYFHALSILSLSLSLSTDHHRLIRIYIVLHLVVPKRSTCDIIRTFSTVEIVMFVDFYMWCRRHKWLSDLSFVLPPTVLFFTTRPLYGSAGHVYQNSMIFFLQLYVLEKSHINSTLQLDTVGRHQVKNKQHPQNKGSRLVCYCFHHSNRYVHQMEPLMHLTYNYNR